MADITDDKRTMIIKLKTIKKEIKNKVKETLIENEYYFDDDLNIVDIDSIENL